MNVEKLFLRIIFILNCSSFPLFIQGHGSFGRYHVTVPSEYSNLRVGKASWGA